MPTTFEGTKERVVTHISLMLMQKCTTSLRVQYDRSFSALENATLISSVPYKYVSEDMNRW